MVFVFLKYRITEMSDKLNLQTWIEETVDYLVDNGFELKNDDDDDTYMVFPSKYGSTKIWISDFNYGIVFKIYTDPSLFNGFKLVNHINRNTKISKLIVSDDISVAIFCLHIPYLTTIDSWLSECLDNFVLEIKLIHQDLN